jgi:hypothetical protein
MIGVWECFVPCDGYPDGRLLPRMELGIVLGCKVFLQHSLLSSCEVLCDVGRQP